MTCKGFVTYIDRYASTTSIYVYVNCDERRGKIKVPNAINSLLEYAENYRINIIPVRGGPVKIKLNSFENAFEIFSLSQKSSFIIDFTAYIKKYFYPIIFDTNIIKGYNNVFRIKDARTTFTRSKELTGILALHSDESKNFELIDVRFLRSLIKGKNIDCIDVAAYPPNTIVRAIDNDVQIVQYPSTIRGKIRLQEKVIGCAVFNYSNLLALHTESNSVKIYSRREKNWIKRHDFAFKEEIRDIRWSILMGSLNLIIDFPERLDAYNLRGDRTSINLGPHLSARLSPLGNRIAVAYTDKIDIIDTVTGDVVFEKNLENVRIMEWTPYGDYLALCNQNACYIYSDLTQEIVVGKVFRSTISSVWWSPRTLSLYLVTSSSINIWFFDPYLITNKNLVTRLSIVE
ncbi:hypothetical protein EYM_03455 [Ignicoccus islandicus DSM 13165]|uniref:Anaphase-promoting complex subunit 4 WD40 domain-containing protein n=1 Tax=Ignicoccus islandicus DSM 13165 TaxID=940295 RepID=A0A0U3E3D4_9CREN|nr:hypothetical protein [Ignicoccus islandicus]ALU12411.1 hypothetical protein EYM_03455 [Ignicoccus islandicus DSM 13165]